MICIFYKTNKHEILLKKTGICVLGKLKSVSKNHITYYYMVDDKEYEGKCDIRPTNYETGSLIIVIYSDIDYDISYAVNLPASAKKYSYGKKYSGNCEFLKNKINSAYILY